MSILPHSNQRGESLVELLAASFILSAILFVLLSIFISNRQGIQQSWSASGESETAAAAVEYMKANADDVFEIMDHGGVIALNPKVEGWDWTVSDTFKNYQLQVDLYPYLAYSTDELIAVVVRIRQAGESTWNEKAALLRNEGTP